MIIVALFGVDAGSKLGVGEEDICLCSPTRYQH